MPADKPAEPEQTPTVGGSSEFTYRYFVSYNFGLRQHMNSPVVWHVGDGVVGIQEQADSICGVELIKELIQTLLIDECGYSQDPPPIIHLVSMTQINPARP